MEEFAEFLNNNLRMKELWERYLTLSLFSQEAREIEKILNEEFKKGEK